MHLPQIFFRLGENTLPQHFKFATPKLVQIPVSENVLFKMYHTDDLSHFLITKIKIRKRVR